MTLRRRSVLRPAAFFALVALAALTLASPSSAKLDSARYREVLKELDAGLRGENPSQVAAALRSLKEDDSDRAVKILVKVFERMWESADVYDAGREFVAALKNEKALRQVRRDALKEKDWQVRVFLVDALAEARGAQEIETLKEATDDKDGRVARAAIRQLGRIRTSASIEALISVMEGFDEKERRDIVWQDARNALTQALGVQLDMGMDYRNFYAARKDKFVEGQGLRQEGDPYAEGGRGSSGTVTLFGQPILCERVVLILDRSGSMVLADPYPAGWKGTSGTSARGREHESENAWVNDPERKRMFRAKEELYKVLDGLAKVKAKVNVIAYSSDAELWKPEGLHDLSGKNLDDVKEWVKKLEPTGVTVTDVAIMTAFDRVKGADCFYLISDGFATHDGETKVPTSRILDQVREANRFAKVQINTFGFGANSGNPKDGADRELMGGIADLTGGRYTEIP